MLGRSLILWPCAAALALSGCGGSGRTFSPPCSSQATHVVAQQIAVRPSRIADKRSTGNNAMPQCTYTAQLPNGHRLAVTVNVDTSPQPYTVLSRTIVEGQQVFSPKRLVPAPISVLHLGLLASWFPNQLQLMSTDGVRLVRTTVLWPGAKQAEKIGLATRLSRLDLKKPKPGRAHGYPAGG